MRQRFDMKSLSDLNNLGRMNEEILRGKDSLDALKKLIYFVIFEVINIFKQWLWQQHFIQRWNVMNSALSNMCRIKHVRDLTLSYYETVGGKFSNILLIKCQGRLTGQKYRRSEIAIEMQTWALSVHCWHIQACVSVTNFFPIATIVITASPNNHLIWELEWNGKVKRI